MLTVREVMTTKMLTLSPELPLRAAVEALAAQRLTGAPVLSGDAVVGTLSANDIVAFVATTPAVPTEWDLGESLSDGYAEQWEEGEAPPATFFTDFWHDDALDVTERIANVSGPEWDLLDEHTVAEAMSTELIIFPPGATLREAAEYMQRSGVHRVLVGDRSALLGIVTTMDVTKAYAHQEPNDADRLQ